MYEVCDTCSYCVVRQPHIIFRGYLWCSHPLIQREIKDPKVEECLFWKKGFWITDESFRGYSVTTWIMDEASTFKVNNDNQTT